MDRVGQLGHAPVLAPVEGHVVHRDPLARRRVRHERRQPASGRSRPASARRMPSSRSLRLDRGQEADRAVVHGEHGHLPPGEAAAAWTGSCRRRPAPRRGRWGRPDRRPSTTPSARCERVLVHLLARDPDLHPRLAGHREHALHGVRGLRRPAVGEQRERLGTVAHGSALRAAASRSETRSRRGPPRPATRSSRGFPPGREGRTRRTRAPMRRAIRARPGPPPPGPAGARRASAPRRPGRPRSRPASNCGLTSASTSWTGAAAASTAGSTFASEMKETSTTTRSGAVGELVRPQVAGRCGAPITVTRGSWRMRQCSSP